MHKQSVLSQYWVYKHVDVSSQSSTFAHLVACTVHTISQEEKTVLAKYDSRSSSCSTLSNSPLSHMWIHVCTCVFTFAYIQIFVDKCVAMCTVHIQNDDRRWEGSRSFQTCHNVPVYELMTAATHPSTSKFITVHHLPTCRVMTFSQSYKNPRNPVV